QGNRRYLFERSKETLGLLYADHWPYRQKATARGIRRSPLHGHLAAEGAVFGELAGWERANWYAKPGQARAYEYAWQRQNWFDNAAEEHRAIRQNVGLYDMSSFGKIRVEGPDAVGFLDHIAGGSFDVPVGRIVYTQFLNPRGGIEADVTITRLSDSAFLVVTPAATRLADQTWMQRHAGGFQVVITDVTAGEAVIAVMGPNARTLLSRVSPNDYGNATNPFGTAQDVEIGMGLARVHRVSYVGELGWEVDVSSDMAAHVFETLWEEGRAMDARLCGLHVMDSCRMEKAFRHFGHDITCEDHVLEAGLGFAVKRDKPAFIGRDALIKRHAAGPKAKLATLHIHATHAPAHGGGSLMQDSKVVGTITSGGWGYRVNMNLAYAFLKPEVSKIGTELT
ncbi:MAG: glycine cleavage T C-terminal barrel domain-containing protein, partial [Pseudomonadota bacterium]